MKKDRTLVSTGSGWKLYLPKDILQLTGFVPKKDQLLLIAKYRQIVISKLNSQEIEENQGRMIRNIIRCGNGWSIYIPLSVVSQLDINPETDIIDYIVNDRTLIIKKAE